MIETLPGEALAKASDEAVSGLPASRREPIPWVVTPGWPPAAVDADALPEEVFSVPSVTLREPEPIDPPPLNELSIALDWYLSPQHAPLVLARELGYFDRLNLSVTITVPADPSVPTKLLAAARTDLALGRQTQLHKEIDQGLPLVRVGTLIGTPMTSLVVNRNSEIETPAQLADKTIGYAVVDSTGPMLDNMLVQHGLSTENVSLKNVSYTLSQALTQRRVDAVIAPLRHVLPLQLEEEGVLTHSFLIEEYGYPTHDGLILMANRDHLATKRNEIKRLLIALEESVLWMLNHPEEAWEALVKAEPGLDTTLNRRAWQATLLRFAQRPSALDGRRYEILDDYLYERGYIDQRTPLERLAVDLHAQ